MPRRGVAGGLPAPPDVSTDLILWYAARAAALAAFFVLAASLLTGMAIRTAYLAPVARNRAVVAVHGFLTWFWVPLVVVHVTALVLDATSRITPLDLLVPFRVNEGRGRNSPSDLAPSACCCSC